MSDMQCESKKSPPLKFSDIGPKRLGIFSANFIRPSHIPIYAGLQIFLFNYLQLLRSYAIILSATTIMCSKCTRSSETHAGWSHLIWHNFVIVGDNWIKICNLSQIWMINRRVKFGLKIPSCLGKMSENASMRFGQWWTFCAWFEVGGQWSRLIWHNFVKVACTWTKFRGLA